MSDKNNLIYSTMETDGEVTDKCIPVDELKEFREYCRQQAGNQNFGGDFESGYGKAFEKCGKIVEELLEEYE